MPQDPADDDDVIRLESSQSPEVFDRSLDFSESAHTVAMPLPLESNQTIASEAEGSSLGTPATPTEVGQKDGEDPTRGSRPVRYNVQTEVGRGGMGIVYRARDEKLGRSLAIKVLQDVSVHRPEHQQREIARFVDEAKLSAQLDHPGLVPVYELEHDAKVGYYFTMRLIKGKHLGEISHLAREQKDGWNLSRAVGVMVKV
jgi:serine/threonine protein kinase